MKYKICDLSPHLFWDVEIENITWEKHQELIVKRVLEIGFLQDWIIIKEIFGIKEIGNIATKLRSLNPVSLNFISVLSNIPIESFRCYTEMQSNPTLWNS
jgi:hypothetical protein